MAGAVKEITGTNFEQEVINSSKPFLLDFSAVWCGPCKALAPIFEQVAAEMGDKVAFGKCDIDNDSEIAGQFGVMAVPTLILFKGGQPVMQHAGLLNKADLTSKINKHLS